MAAPADWLCVGVIGKPKGVKGAVRITTFTERPEDIAAYGPVYDAPGGRPLRLRLLRVVKGGVVATIAGVADRNQAEALRGTRLYLPRSALPEIAEEETYYHADLIGLVAEDPAGRRLGRIVAVYDFGAGDVIEIGDDREPLLVPLTREHVPVIDVAQGRVVVAADALGNDEEKTNR